ncbi:MAG: hypothetical protein WCT46_03890 [Candidatus Gracilibacteria bacterium]
MEIKQGDPGIAVGCKDFEVFRKVYCGNGDSNVDFGQLFYGQTYPSRIGVYSGPNGKMDAVMRTFRVRCFLSSTVDTDEMPGTDVDLDDDSDGSVSLIDGDIVVSGNDNLDFLTDSDLVDSNGVGSSAESMDTLTRYFMSFSIETKVCFNSLMCRCGFDGQQIWRALDWYVNHCGFPNTHDWLPEMTEREWGWRLGTLGDTPHFEGDELLQSFLNETSLAACGYLKRGREDRERENIPAEINGMSEVHNKRWIVYEHFHRFLQVAITGRDPGYGCLAKDLLK